MNAQPTNFLRRNFTIEGARRMWHAQELAERECDKARREVTWLTERVDGRLMPLWAIGMPGTLDNILRSSVARAA